MSAKTAKRERKNASEFISTLATNMTLFDRINYALFRNLFKPMMRTQKRLRDPKFYRTLTKTKRYIWSFLFDDGYYKRLHQKQTLSRQKQFRINMGKEAEKHGKLIAERKAERKEAELNRVTPHDPVIFKAQADDGSAISKKESEFRAKAFKDAKPSDVDDLK